MAQTDEFVLVVTHGGEEQHYLLGKEETIVLGRDEADIVLPDDGQLISRRHALLTWHENVYWITDCSRNGTALGSEMLTLHEPTVWVKGQVVTIGDYQLRLRPAGDSALVQLAVTPAQAEIECGYKQSFDLVLTNNDERVSHLQFQLEGVDPAWLALSSTSVKVMPEHSDSVELTVQPPRTSSSRAGDYLLRIGVINQYDQLVATRQVRLAVLPFHDHAIAARPQQAKANKPIRLRIHNRGNQEAAYQVVLSDGQEALRFEPAHFDLRVAPGAVAEKRFWATESQRRWIGPQIEHDVSVNVTPEYSEQGEAHDISVAASGCLSPLMASILSMLLVLLTTAAIMIWQKIDGDRADLVAMEKATATQAIAANLIVTETANWLDQDGDVDGLRNEEELRLSTEPMDRDSDDDGLSDGDEVLIWGTRPSGPNSQDSDGDGLFDGDDALKCNPKDSDTDDDGRPDGDPLEPDCKNPDFNGNGIRDGDEVDPVSTPVPPSPTPTDTPTSTPTPSPTVTATPTHTPTPGPSVVTSVLPGFDDRDGCVDIGWLITGVTEVMLSVDGAPAEGMAGDIGGSFVRWDRPACFDSDTQIVWEIKFPTMPPIQCKWEINFGEDGEEDVVAPTNSLCTTPRR